MGEEINRAGAQLLDCMKPLLIHDSDKDVRIQIDKVPEGWQLMGVACVVCIFFRSINATRIKV